MSAYAMPGLLPPFESCYTKTEELSSRTGSKPVSSTEQEEESPSSVRDIARIPEYSSYASGWSVPPKKQKKEVEIAVRNARIDAVKLVQGIMNLSASSCAGGSSLSGGSSFVHPFAGGASGGRPGTCSRRRRFACSTATADSSSSTNSHKLQDDVMLFDLDIDVHGRTYSVTRSLSSIKQLRRDLIREIQDEIKLEMMFSSDVIQQSSWKAHLDEEEIPELPGVPESGNGLDASSGLGFSLLNDIIRSYAPKIERWFNEVTEAIFSVISTKPVSSLSSPAANSSGRCFECRSAVLTHFLRDPAALPPYVKLLEEELSKRTRSSEKLDAIEENDSEG